MKLKNGGVALLEEYVPPKILETEEDFLSYTSGMGDKAKESMRFLDGEFGTWYYDPEKGWGFVVKDDNSFVSALPNNTVFPMVRIK